MEDALVAQEMTAVLNRPPSNLSRRPSRGGMRTDRSLSRGAPLFQAGVELGAEVSAQIMASSDAAMAQAQAAQRKARDTGEKLWPRTPGAGFGSGSNLKSVCWPETPCLRPQSEASIAELKANVGRLERELKDSMRDLSKGMAKKLALMIDLIASLSDQVAHSAGGAPPVAVPSEAALEPQ